MKQAPPSEKSTSMTTGSQVPSHRIQARLTSLYGPERAAGLVSRVLNLIDAHRVPARGQWSERDAVLITYGGTVTRRGEAPLATLTAFVREHLGDAFSCVHILPFFPYSSDDGFAVVDYRRVDPMLGTWEDVDRLAARVDLMMDLVLNHVSSRSEWFKQFLGQALPGKDYFIEVCPDSDVSQVVRPRTHPLVLSYHTENGPKEVWATFSEDQIDLNFDNPDVLLEMLSVLLLYVQRKARMVRLDAVAFLWKRIGTSCIHLPETHEVVKLMRDVVEAAAPGTILLTETNVPHVENVSYFGKSDEAHMVYQFSLPPLLLHALHRGSSHYLTEWAMELESAPPGCTFLNFTASHDGIGMRPAEGILPQAEIDLLVGGMARFGGYTSARSLGGGRKAVYELNITYFDALKGTTDGVDEHQVARFICSQLVAISLQGIPAVYVQSLLASHCDHEAVDQTGHLRAVNRRRWSYDDVSQRLEDPYQAACQITQAVRHALHTRRRHAAFHPEAPQRVHRMGDHVFVFERGPFGPSNDHVLVVANMTRQLQTVFIPETAASEGDPQQLLVDAPLDPDTRRIELGRYQVAWVSL